MGTSDMTDEQKKACDKIEKERLDAIDKERIESAKKYLSTALNRIEASIDPLKWACERNEWNEEVVYQIEEAALKLGYALATLTNWYEEIEDDIQ